MTVHSRRSTALSRISLCAVGISCARWELCVAHSRRVAAVALAKGEPAAVRSAPGVGSAVGRYRLCARQRSRGGGLCVALFSRAAERIAAQQDERRAQRAEEAATTVVGGARLWRRGAESLDGLVGECRGV